ncbi:hypothetical protein J6590_084993 [Homalodisca vitripennis]|nr:hypothetical protein J6590_102804 [Homalodisca vitripennis]KAG8265851.1 hypothetical protein J6590_084993 [Homalodisca vitripennis]
MAYFLVDTVLFYLALNSMQSVGIGSKGRLICFNGIFILALSYPYESKSQHSLCLTLEVVQKFLRVATVAPTILELHPLEEVTPFPGGGEVVTPKHSLLQGLDKSASYEGGGSTVLEIGQR